MEEKEKLRGTRNGGVRNQGDPIAMPPSGIIHITPHLSPLSAYVMTTPLVQESNMQTYR